MKYELVYNDEKAKRNQTLRNQRHHIAEGLRRPLTPRVFEETISLPPAREIIRLPDGIMIKHSGKQVAYCAR